MNPRDSKPLDTYIPQVEDAIWHESSLTIAGGTPGLGRRAMRASDAAGPEGIERFSRCGDVPSSPLLMRREQRAPDPNDRPDLRGRFKTLLAGEHGLLELGSQIEANHELACRSICRYY
jgi:hypothetical protein